MWCSPASRRQRSAPLDALGGVGDRPVERRPTGAEAEGRDHQARVAEHLLCLDQALALDAADEPVGFGTWTLSRNSAAVLLSRMPCLSSGCASEARRSRSTTNQVGPPSVNARIVEASAMPPLLIHCLRAVDEVVGDVPVVVLLGYRGRCQRTQVAAGLGLGGAVREEDALLGDATQPLRTLLLGRADEDRVGAEERGENRGGQTDVDAAHAFAHAVDVERAAAHPAVLLGQEDQLDPELLALHGPDKVFRAHVVMVELEHPVVVHAGGDEVGERLEHEVEGVEIESAATDVTGRGQGRFRHGLTFLAVRLRSGYSVVRYWDVPTRWLGQREPLQDGPSAAAARRCR